jgi:hypothetical protein
MTKETKETVLIALQNYMGDDLERAKAAWKGLNSNAMNELYGKSGKTRQQILDEYQEHRDKVNIAIKEIQSL